MKLAAAFCLLSAAAQAQEFIRVNDPLTDTDFYRLVACAAQVAGPCQKDSVRWSPADAQDVSTGIVKVAATFPETTRQLAETSLKDAIAEVNAAGADVHLTLSDAATKPDIAVYLLAVPQGGTVQGTGLAPLDGTVMDAAKTQLWWRSDFSLIEGAIVVARDISPADIRSVMLEEVTQSLGLLTDIGGDYYHHRSIFSETGNRRTRLGRQDIMALRRHYPKP